MFTAIKPKVGGLVKQCNGFLVQSSLNAIFTMCARIQAGSGPALMAAAEALVPCLTIDSTNQFDSARPVV